MGLTVLAIPYFGIDVYYLVLIVPALIFGLIAQSTVRLRFQKYSKVRSSSGRTGKDAAEQILKQNQLYDVRVERIQGQLTDHYDPRTKVLRLSEATYDSPSVAAIGVAAHEAGHAVQDATGYLPNKIRASLIPVAQLGSSAGPYLAIFGLLFQSTLGDWMFTVGMFLYFGALLFFLITLPVEFDASRRAVLALSEGGMMSEDEIKGAKKVLSAAAMTYVASALTSFASFLRLLLLSRSRRRN
jgi:Zn-dependent membrane protease YugP